MSDENKKFEYRPDGIVSVSSVPDYMLKDVVFQLIAALETMFDITVSVEKSSGYWGPDLQYPSGDIKYTLKVTRNAKDTTKEYF